MEIKRKYESSADLPSARAAGRAPSRRTASGRRRRRHCSGRPILPLLLRALLSLLPTVPPGGRFHRRKLTPDITSDSFGSAYNGVQGILGLVWSVRKARFPPLVATITLSLAHSMAVASAFLPMAIRLSLAPLRVSFHFTSILLAFSCQISAFFMVVSVSLIIHWFVFRPTHFVLS